MNKTDILCNPQLLKRFSRDYNVPVSTFSPIHFENQLFSLSMYDLKYRKKFEEFIEELSNYDTAEAYFEYYNKIKDSAINNIKESAEFNVFCDNIAESKYKFVKRELYCDENNEKTFISIDMSKANFTVVNLFCPDIFKGKSWENYLKDLGASDYIAESKYIRQVIFGACNPKKQIQAQIAIMSDLAHSLEQEGYCIYSVNSDEIILNVDDDLPSIADIQLAIKHYVSPHILNAFKIEYFKLIKNNVGYEKFLYKTSYKATYGPVFKCIDSDIFCQVIKYYYRTDITESDLVFDYKGNLARFMVPIPNPFIN